MDGGPCGLWVWGWTVSDLIKLSEVVVTVCEMCLAPAPHIGTMKGEEECHTPGCAFWMDDAPTGRTLDHLRQWAGKS